MGLAGGADGTSATSLAGVLPADIAAANAAIETVLGLAPGDLLAGTVTPVIDATGAANPGANAYGQILAGLSGMEVNLGLTTAQVLALVTADAADGSLSPATQQALVEGAFAAHGNAAGLAATLGYTDTTAPVAQLDAVTDDAGTVTGPLADGAATDDGLLTLTGTCEIGASITVFDNGVAIGNATVTCTSWTMDVPAADGQTLVLSVTETDLFGNTSAPTADFTVIGDQTGPSVVITDNLNGGVATDPTQVTFDFSEDVFNFSTTDISIANGVVTGLVQDANDASIWTATITPDADPTTPITIDLAAGAVSDAAGNAGDAAHYKGGDVPAPSATANVVFDLFLGVSTNDGVNMFDPNVTYDIYIRVDSNYAGFNTGGGSGAGSWNLWGNWGALGADDKIHFVGSGTPIDLLGTYTQSQYGVSPLTINTSTLSSYATQGSYATFSGGVNHYQGAGYTLTAVNLGTQNAAYGANGSHAMSSSGLYSNFVIGISMGSWANQHVNASGAVTYSQMSTYVSLNYASYWEWMNSTNLGTIGTAEMTAVANGSGGPQMGQVSDDLIASIWTSQGLI